MRIVALFAALVFAAYAGAVRVVVVATSTARDRLPEQVVKETQAELSAAIVTALTAEIEKLGGTLARAPEGHEAPGQKAGEAEYAAFARSADADAVIRVELTSWRQRNRAPGDVLRNPNEPGSRTEVEVNLAVWRNGSLSRLEKKRTTVGGPFFGTQRRDEMSGSPDDISRLIRNVNRRRAQVVSRAVWEATQDVIGRLLTGA